MRRLQITDCHSPVLGQLALASLLSVVPGEALAMIEMHGGGSWTASLDHYCARLGPGLWAEPLNALSNIGFLATAAISLDRQKRSGWSDKPIVGLALLAGSVGIGSFLFLTLANCWTLLADIVPIALFIYAYMFVALQRFLGLTAWASAAGVLAAFVLSPTLQSLLAPMLGASAAYAPALITTLGVAVAVPLFGKGPGPALARRGGLRVFNSSHIPHAGSRGLRPLALWNALPLAHP